MSRIALSRRHMPGIVRLIHRRRRLRGISSARLAEVIDAAIRWGA